MSVPFSLRENTVGAGLASARNKIQLSETGQIIDNQWNDISKQYDNVQLDKHIIMPNHIHGILIINNNINKQADARPATTISDIICYAEIK